MKITIDVEPKNFWIKNLEKGELNEILLIANKIHKLMKKPKKEQVIIKGMKDLRELIEKENEELIEKIGTQEKIIENLKKEEERGRIEMTGGIEKIKDEIEIMKKDREIGEVKSKHSTIKGGMFEEQLLLTLKQCFPEDEIINMSKISRGADIKFIDKKNGTKIAIEAKNYSTSLPKKEVDKFMRDLNGMDDVVWGILISRNSITNASKMELRKLHGEKTKYMWLVSDVDETVVLPFLILAIKRVEGIIQMHQIPATSDFDRNSFNDFVNEQLEVYQELVKTLEIIGEKKYQIQKILDDMMIVVERQKKKFEDALSKLGDFIVLKPQEKIKKKDFVLKYPKSIDIIKKLRKNNFKLRYANGGILEYRLSTNKKRYIRIEKNRYIIYGYGFEKNNIITFGNETLLYLAISSKF